MQNMWTGEAETLTVKEMQNDTREEFDYFECGNCHCLQIEEVHGKLDAYYGNTYYSYRKPPLMKKKPEHIFSRNKT